MKLDFRLTLVVLILFFASCKNDEPLNNAYQGYPIEVGKIMLENCAVPGCHTDASKEAAGGLSLQSWDRLFEGTRAGAAVIPFRSDQSFLSYFINTDSTLLPVLAPTMPFNEAALSSQKVQQILDWIDAGAADAFGHVKFSEQMEQRKKYYVANQGCDLLAVFDAESDLIMRYVDIGMIDGFVESPHMLKVSPDGNYLYAVFLVGNSNIEIYNTGDEALEGRIDIGQGQWNTMIVSPDGKFAYCVDLQGSKIAVVDLEARVLIDHLFVNKQPHGSTVNPLFNTLLVTQQFDNGIFKFTFNDPSQPQQYNFDNIDLVQGIPAANGHQMWPHEVGYVPDGSRYFVTCESSNEIRFLDAANDQLLKVIVVGDKPQEFAYSTQFPYLFISCTEDITNFGDPTFPGSIAVINYQTMELITHLQCGVQPHGLVVDEENKRVIVANRNQNPNGPAPHHTSECGGRNGSLNIIDMKTLNVTGFNPEVSVDPYSITLKE